MRFIKIQLHVMNQKRITRQQRKVNMKIKPYSPINNQSTEPKNQNIEKDNNHSSQETSHNQHHENKGDHFDHIINVITSFFKTLA